MAAPSLDIWEDSSVDESVEGWKTFVKMAKCMTKHFPPNHRFTILPGVKIRGMPSLKNKRKKKMVQKKVQIPQEDEYEQPSMEEIMQCNMGSMEEYEVDTKVDEINLCFDRSIPSADSAQQNEEADSFKTEKKSKGNEIKVSSSEKNCPRGSSTVFLESKRTLSPILVKQRSHLNHMQQKTLSSILLL
ncbi:unnamed protein product [Prunus armeniaca]